MVYHTAGKLFFLVQNKLTYRSSFTQAGVIDLSGAKNYYYLMTRLI